MSITLPVALAWAVGIPLALGALFLVALIAFFVGYLHFETQDKRAALRYWNEVEQEADDQRAALEALVDGVDWEMVPMSDEVPERREKHMALLDQADDALGRPRRVGGSMKMPDPSFVLVQVDQGIYATIREQVEQFMPANAPSGAEHELTEAILSALGLDRPGLRESYLQRAIARTRGDENQHGDLDVSNRLRAALAAAKEWGC